MYKIFYALRTWWWDNEVEIKLIGVGLLVILLVMGFFTGLSYFSCNNQIQLYGNLHEIKYIWPSGCMIKLPFGYWIGTSELHSLELSK